jgi:hypothetical protein
MRSKKMEDNEKPLEDMNEEEIESVMIDGVSQGLVDVAGVKDGNIAFSINKKGENRVLEMFGGKESLEISNKLYSKLIKFGTHGFKVESNFHTFTLVATLTQIFNYYQNWDSLKKALELDNIEF